MSAAQEPPGGTGVPAPAPGPVPMQPPPRPRVPGGVTCLLWAAVVLFLGAVACCGAGALVFRSLIQPKIVEAEAKRKRDAAERAVVAEAEALLAHLAERVEEEAVQRGEYPETLDEAPPPDPWGTPVEYKRRSAERAQLRSAGPDGRFNTGDDVTHELRARPR